MANPAAARPTHRAPPGSFVSPAPGGASRSQFGYHSLDKIHAVLQQDFPGGKVKDMRATIEIINGETLTEQEWDAFQREHYETDSEDEGWNAKYRPKRRLPPTTETGGVPAVDAGSRGSDPAAATEGHGAADGRPAVSKTKRGGAAVPAEVRGIVMGLLDAGMLPVRLRDVVAQHRKRLPERKAGGTKRESETKRLSEESERDDSTLAGVKRTQ